MGYYCMDVYPDLLRVIGQAIHEAVYVLMQSETKWLLFSCTARGDSGSVGLSHGQRQRRILSFSLLLLSWRKNVILFWSDAILP